MGVGQFETKIAVVVRDDLEIWQRLNVTAFLISGVTAHAGPPPSVRNISMPTDKRYLALLVQPVLVFEAGATSCGPGASAPSGAR